MLTNDKVVAAINEQIGNEFGASLQYVAIAAYFAADALPQLSQHFFKQADEEDEHALRFINYVVDVGGRVVIPAIDAPQSQFHSAEEAIKLSLDQEIQVTHQINALVELARSENDYITINFLQWFLAEQLEEVSSMDTLAENRATGGKQSASRGRISRPRRRSRPRHAPVRRLEHRPIEITGANSHLIAAGRFVPNRRRFSSAENRANQRVAGPRWA